MTREDRLDRRQLLAAGIGLAERSVDKVAALEVQLGINDLKQFTPRG